MASSNVPQSQSNLVDINSATLGVAMPEVTLANGMKVQTGTIGALLVNIKAYDQLCSSSVTAEDTSAKAELEGKLKAAVPLLARVGMFDLFSLEEWLTGPGAQRSPGRKFVGKMGQEYLANAAAVKP